jgi:hypothetical protein
MSPDHDVLVLFQEANPVMDLDLLEPAGKTASDFLTTARSREDRVVTGGGRVGWRARASVAAAIGAIAILTIFLWNNPDEPGPVGTTPPTSVPAPATDAELATEWVTCVLGDCEPGVLVVSATTINGQPAPQYSAFRIGIDAFEVAATCEGEIVVTCTVTGSDLVRQVFGHSFNEEWVIEMDDDGVVSATVESEDAATMDAYEAWLVANYADEMASSTFTAFEPWIEHAEEFMESDAWLRPYEIDIVGTWQMLKGEIWTFSEDGIYTVADRNGVYETGNYTFDEPNITIQATESTACPTQVGVYEMRFYSVDRFGWVLVEDECGIRGNLLNGLADRSE